MGNIPAAVAGEARRATGAPAAYTAMERSSRVSILSLTAGLTRSFRVKPCPGVEASLEVSAARPYTLAGARCPRLLCRRRWLYDSTVQDP